MNDDALAREALRVARRAAAESTEKKEVIDAGLCHGAAGVAHLFNRIYQTSDDEACGDAARRWFARALEMRRPGEGLAGFVTWGARRDEPGPGWIADPGLLIGASGIGLALLGAVSTVEPAWDRMLLASAQP